MQCVYILQQYVVCILEITSSIMTLHHKRPPIARSVLIMSLSDGRGVARVLASHILQLLRSPSSAEVDIALRALHGSIAVEHEPCNMTGTRACLGIPKINQKFPAAAHILF